MMTNCSGCVYNKGYCSLPRVLECPVKTETETYMVQFRLMQKSSPRLTR